MNCKTKWERVEKHSQTFPDIHTGPQSVGCLSEDVRKVVCLVYTLVLPWCVLDVCLVFAWRSRGTSVGI